MVGVIELDAIAIDEADCHVRVDGEEPDEKRADFG